MTGAPPKPSDCQKPMPGAPVIGFSDLLSVRRTHVDLFSGIGGFALAAQANNVETKIFCEQNENCCDFLIQQWGLPIFDDIHTMLKLCREYVHIVGGERFLQVTPDVSHAIRRRCANGESSTGKNTDKINATTIGEESRRSLIITEENARAVESPLWSFFASIISTTTERESGENFISRQSGKLPSNGSCHPANIKSSATTATTQNPSTEYVRINPWLLTGGPPCQPASRAGRQQGAGDDRWLWGQTLEAVELLNPTWALFENPPGILDVGLDGILAELGRLGYESQPISIPACAVNSPQDRERIWILAHRSEPGLQGRDAELSQRATGRTAQRTQSSLGNSESFDGRLLLQPMGQGEAGAEPARPTESGDVANGKSVRCKARKSKDGKPRSAQEGQSRLEHQGTAKALFLANSEVLTERAGLCEGDQDNQKRTEAGRRRLGDVLGAWSDYQWIACEKGKVRRFPNRLHSLGNGVSSRILEALGNAIVWPVAAEIISAMIATEARTPNAELSESAQEKQ